jgi:solute carrier family 10 (sodium/bile acid cotransporter), member 7
VVESENEKITPKPSKITALYSLLKRFGLDGFILGLIGMIFLAYLWPKGGIKNGSFSLAQAANSGVSLIFFFYGLRLNPEKLKAGLSNWRLHSIVHISTFLVFPFLVLACKSLFDTGNNSTMWLGAFYLATLPSTVSSSVVMVSIAKGNIPAAIFNASISSLAGVFITPMWMGLFLSNTGNSFELWGIIGKLIVQVLVPVALGILLHHKFGAFAEKHRKSLRYFDQSIILLIVYTSFCESFDKHMFTGFGIIPIVGIGVAMIALFFVMFALITLVSRAFHFNREDRITAVFCGSKKSLVHGTVMSKVLFPGSHMAGIILLPVMMYHALQLVAASIIAQSMAKYHKN